MMQEMFTSVTQLCDAFGEQQNRLDAPMSKTEKKLKFVPATRASSFESTSEDKASPKNSDQEEANEQEHDDDGQGNKIEEDSDDD